MSENGKKVVSNVIWQFAERILAQAVSLLVSVVLARILLPEDYGAISMVMVFITIANVFVTYGIPTALIQKKDADRLDFSSVFHFNFFLSIVIYIILFFSSDFVARFYKLPILSPVIKVLGIRIIVASVNSVQHAYVSRHMMFKKYFWSTLFGTVLSGVVGLWMAYSGYGVWALVAQYMTNTTVDTIVLFVTVEWKPRLEYSFARVRLLFAFGWKILFEALSNTVFGQLHSLIIGKVYTSDDLAYYTKGQHFPSLIVNNIASAIGAVLFPAIASEQNNPERVLEMLRKSIRISSYVVYPMLIGLAAAAKPFISVLLTDKWLETVPYLQIYCFLFLSNVAFIPRHQALNGTGRSDIFMKEHIAQRIVGLVLLLLVYKISVLAVAMSGVVSTLILAVIVAYTSKKYSGYAYRDQIRDIVPTLIGCVVMGVPVFLLQYLGLPDIVTLVLQVILGAGIYLLYSRLLKLEEYSFCKRYASDYINKFRRPKTT